MSSPASPYGLRERHGGRAVTSKTPNADASLSSSVAGVHAPGSPSRIRPVSGGIPAAVGWWRISLRTHLLIAAIYRIALVAFSEWFDQQQTGKHSVLYTDIDYMVFTDAAKQVLNV